MSLVAVADTHAEAFKRLDKIRGYLRTTTIVARALPIRRATQPLPSMPICSQSAEGRTWIIDRDSRPVNLRKRRTKRD